jgi:hypothetical protein
LVDVGPHAPLHNNRARQTDDQRGDGELELRAHRPHRLGFQVDQGGVVAASWQRTR